MKKALMPSYQMADQPVLALGIEVHASLTGNADFPSPTPDLTVLQGSITAYTADLGVAKYGSRDQKADKNAEKKNLISILRQLADYVNKTANGDPTMLAGCGFPLSRDPKPTVLGTPELKVENGISGQLIASSPGVSGAVAFKHRYTADPAAATWQEVLSTKAKCKFDGLIPGTVYSVQMLAIGTNDQVTFSSVVTKMVA